MSLTALLDTAPKSVTDVWLEAQPAEEQAAFDAYLRNNLEDSLAWPVTRLHAACQQRGLRTRMTAFRDYCRTRKATL